MLITFKKIEELERFDVQFFSKKEKSNIEQFLSELLEDEYLVLDVERQEIYFNNVLVGEVFYTL